MSIEQLTTFLGWCAVLNIILLAFSAIMIILFQQAIAKIHTRMFALETTQLAQFYFNYLANYKIATLIFTIIPYLALKIMT